MQLASQIVQVKQHRLCDDQTAWLIPVLPIIGPILDKDTELWEPPVGINTMGSHVIHHIKSDDGGRYSL